MTNIKTISQLQKKNYLIKHKISIQYLIYIIRIHKMYIKYIISLENYHLKEFCISSKEICDRIIKTKLK
jgi:hypothetical protein